MKAALKEETKEHKETRNALTKKLDEQKDAHKAKIAKLKAAHLKFTE